MQRTPGDPGTEKRPCEDRRGSCLRAREGETKPANTSIVGFQPPEPRGSKFPLWKPPRRQAVFGHSRRSSPRQVAGFWRPRLSWALPSAAPETQQSLAERVLVLLSFTERWAGPAHPEGGSLLGAWGQSPEGGLFKCNTPPASGSVHPPLCLTTFLGRFRSYD